MWRGFGVLVVGGLLFSPPPAALAQGYPHCPPGQAPQFLFGFAALQDRLGPNMGEPVECEHSTGSDGDTLQRTTKGLAYWRKSTNTPTFTDGSRHWSLTPDGLVFWEGSSSEPPGAASEGARGEATVTRVIDGSSLDARVRGARTAVGYLGVETPAADRPRGRRALERNRELAGIRVLLEEAPAYQFDALGRRLYYAYTVDGRLIDEVLVREGLGRAVRTDASRGAHLAAVEAQAQAAGRGCLWGGADGQ